MAHRDDSKKHGFLGRKRFLIFKGLAFFAFATSVWLIVNVRNIQEYISTYELRDREVEDIEMLEQRITDLERKQRSLQMNGFEQERQVRDRIGMHFPGEKVIFLKPDEGARETTRPTATATPVIRKATPAANDSRVSED